MSAEHCGRCGYLRQYHGDGTLLCPGTKTVKWQDPPPVERRDYRDIIREDARRRLQAIKDARKPYVAPERKPPQVAPRQPYGPGELAGYRKGQAVGLGRAALALGWTVRALYWRSHDDTEGCGVWLSRGELRALATWSRPSGAVGALNGWVAHLAYGWIDGQLPQRANHTRLQRLIEEGES